MPAKSSLKRMCQGATCSVSSPPNYKIFKNKSLSSYAEACDRVGVSDRGAALLSTSLLEDIGFVDTDSPENIIDRNKIRRERRHRRASHANCISEITCVNFDGKRDVAYIQEKKKMESSIDGKLQKSTYH